jgi:hypothetical protein
MSCGVTGQVVLDDVFVDVRGPRGQVMRLLKSAALVGRWCWMMCLLMFAAHVGTLPH